ESRCSNTTKWSLLFSAIHRWNRSSRGSTSTYRITLALSIATCGLRKQCLRSAVESDCQMNVLFIRDSRMLGRLCRLRSSMRYFYPGLTNCIQWCKKGFVLVDHYSSIEIFDS